MATPKMTFRKLFKDSKQCYQELAKYDFPDKRSNSRKTNNESLLMKHCIYTIKLSDDLKKIFSQKRKGSFREYNNWKSGKELLLQAKSQGLNLPVLFAYAEKTDNVQYWAYLTEIQIQQKTDGMFETIYSFKDLKKIQKPQPKSKLILRSTNRPIHPNFIRPYAICHTPAYI